MHRTAARRSKKIILPTVNINERIFAALETDELVPPSWPERPLDRTENGVGTNENDRFSFEEDDF